MVALEFTPRSWKVGDLFPTPAFLVMPMVGVDFSAHAIRFVELSRKSKEYELVAWAYQEIPEGILVSGDIKRKEELRSILSEFRKKHNIRFIRASLPEEKAYLFKTQIPDMDESEMEEAIQFKLEENVPLKPAEAVIDFTVVPKRGNEKERDVSVTVFPQAVIDEYIDLFHSAGMIPLSFEIEAQAIARSVVPERNTETLMILDMGRSRTGLSVVHEGVVSFTTTLEIGGGAITRAIEKYFSVTTEEAEKIKHDRGFVKSKNNRELYESMLATIGALKDEINKHFVYWHTHAGVHLRSNGSITSLILCGSEAHLPGLSEYLSEAMSLPVKQANVWTNAFSFNTAIPEIPFGESLGYATAVGLALQDRVNVQ